MKNKKILYLEDLVKFCEEKKMSSFSSKDSGYQLCVQVPATFKKKEVVTEVEDNTLLYCILKTCHIGLNRNGSYISEESMKAAMPTLKYKPILCNFTDTENGKDFTSHDMEIDKDGNINYIERQVGCFTSDEPYLEYDEEKDKTYVMAYAAIPRDYTEAADIIERKDGTKVSVELSINEMSFNSKEKYLQLDSFVFSGCTLLGVDPDTGKEVGEGMEGSRLDIIDFSQENNSIVNYSEENKDINKLIETLEALNSTLSKFNINQEDFKSSEIYGKEEHESMNDEIKVEEEVTEVESVEETAEEVTEVVEDTAEEIENEVTETEEFTEEVAETETDETVEEDTPEVGEEEVEETEVEEVEDNTESYSSMVKYSVESKGEIKTYEVSLDEKIYAIQDLVNITYGESDNTYYGVKVYEDYVIMLDYWSGRAYKQSYSTEEDSYTLTGDRVEVYSVWVTKEEEEALNEMKSNYSLLEQFKLDTENALLHAQRETILYDKKYSVLAEKDENNEYKNEAYAKLVSEMDNYSLTDLEKELKSVFADYITNGGQFAYIGEQEEKPMVSKKLFSTSTSKKPSRYGNLFNK